MDNNRASAQNFSRREKQFMRDRDRMSLHNARKTGGTSIDTRNVDNWAEDMRYEPSFRYENPPAWTSSGRGRRAPKKGGKGFPPKDRAEMPKAEIPAAKSYRSTTETPPSDELRYDISSLGMMTPQQDKFLFNHTSDGLLNVVEQSYNKIISIDGRISRRLPFSVYLHNINQLYHVHLATIAEVTGQQSTWANKMPSDDFQRLVSADTVCIPEEIWFWLRGLGQFKDKNGLTWIPNVPYSISPKAARVVNKISIAGGDFGPPDAASHNVYENHLCPYTTRAFVTAMLRDVPVNGVINYDPLPANLIPAGHQATANFLGKYADNRRLHAECLAFYDQFNDNWALGYGAKIAYNPYLWTKMNAALHGLKDKIKMRVGLPPITSGSQALYGTISYSGPDPVVRTANGVIESCCELDPQSLSIAAINTYRRRRERESPGYCFLDAENHAPAGWVDTINNEYNLVTPFAPTIGVTNLDLNNVNFTRPITEGRYNIILDEITRLTTIRR